MEKNFIDLAIQIAVDAHNGQLDLDGNPVILHPLSVGLAGKNTEEQIVGFLHDVVEDTEWSFDMLKSKGFSDNIVETLTLLTHTKGEDYFDYISRIISSKNTTAINVKLNDLKHNLIRGRAGNHVRIVNKHEKALRMIKDAL